jgi:hypothetical protein
MDLLGQDVINYAFAGFSFLAGWLIRIIWQSLRDLRGSLNMIERSYPDKYATKPELNAAVSDLRHELRSSIADLRTDFRDMKSEIKEGFLRADDRLDTILQKLASKDH